MFRKFWDWLANLFIWHYRLIEVDDIPANPRRKKLYLVGENGHQWFAVMACPCGCGETIHLSLVEGRPRWKVDVHRNGRASLYPSVWRTDGCESHFWVRNGRIYWCGLPEKC